MPSNDELDIYNVLEDAFLRYVGGSDSLFGEDIHNLFQRVTERIEAHTQAEVERARIDELERLGVLVWDDEGTTDWLLIMNDDRIAELKKGE